MLPSKSWQRNCYKRHRTRAKIIYCRIFDVKWKYSFILRIKIEAHTLSSFLIIPTTRLISSFFEFVPNGSLFDWLQTLDHHWMSEMEASHIMYQVVQALQHLRKINIWHRDVKPENILILKMEMLVSGFGFACYADGNCSQIKLKGTEAFMAPETYQRKSELIILVLAEFHCFQL